MKGFTFHDLGQFEKPPTFRFAQRKVEVPVAPAAGGAPGAPALAGAALAVELQALGQKLAAGQVDEALAGYEALAAREPGSATVHRMLGAAAKKKGDLARAEAELRKAVELDPQDALAHRDLGVLLYETSRLSDALAEGEKAVALHSDDPGLLFNLGLMYQNAGRSQEAWDTLLKAEAADPGNAELQYHLGTVALGLNKPEEAVARLQKYLDASPANAQNVATLAAAASLPGSNVDAAIAAVTSGMVRTDGAILEIGADGPMSTPRRPAPRSRSTPITISCRGTRRAR